MRNAFPVLVAFALAAVPARAVEPPDRGVDEPAPAPSTEDGALARSTFACLLLSDDQCGDGANATPILTAPGGRVAPKTFAADEARFGKLAAAYPNGGVETIKSLIGRPKEAWIVNTCAIRVSFAMNAAGFRIDRSVQDAKGLADPNGRINFLPDHSGVRNGDVYVYRVDELARYMLSKYGKPQVWAKAEKGDGPEGARAAVRGKKGVILFVVKSWSDATGHFDLWDGEKAAHEDYFDKASDVFLWQ